MDCQKFFKIILSVPVYKFWLMLIDPHFAGLREMENTSIFQELDLNQIKSHQLLAKCLNKWIKLTIPTLLKIYVTLFASKLAGNEKTEITFWKISKKLKIENTPKLQTPFTNDFSGLYSYFCDLQRKKILELNWFTIFLSGSINRF